MKDNQIPETTLQKPTIVYGDVIIGVHGENFSMMFDKKEGGISSLKYNNFEYITRTPKVSFWRAMTDNDTGASSRTILHSGMPQANLQSIKPFHGWNRKML